MIYLPTPVLSEQVKRIRDMPISAVCRMRNSPRTALLTLFYSLLIAFWFVIDYMTNFVVCQYKTANFTRFGIKIISLLTKCRRLHDTITP